MRFVNNLVAGAIGGVVGALVMTMIRSAGEEMGLIAEPLPHKVERRLAVRAGVGHYLSATQERVLAQGMHLGFGAAYGAAYGSLHHTIDLPATVDGPLYGTLLYGLNLGAIAPMLPITPGRWQETPTTIARRLLLHLVYGLVTGVVTEQIHHRFFHGAAAVQHSRPPLARHPGALSLRHAAPPAPKPADAFDWTAHMLVGPGLHGQLVRQGDYLIGCSVAKASTLWQRRTGEPMPQADAAVVYLEIMVADAADQHLLPDLRVSVKLVDPRGDEVSTYQQPFLWRPWPGHYGRAWRVPAAGRYTLHVRIEPPAPSQPEQRPGSYAAHRAFEPVEVEFPGIKIDVGQPAKENQPIPQAESSLLIPRGI